MTIEEISETRTSSPQKTDNGPLSGEDSCLWTGTLNFIPAIVKANSPAVTSGTQTALELAKRRAVMGHVITAGCAIAATAIAFRRGRRMGFKNLFNSISAPKDFVYIGFLYGAGDVSQQLVTQARRTLCEPPDQRKWDFFVDWPGVGTVTLVGCAIFGPINHYWYTFLDKFIVGTSLKSVVKKVIVDQLSLPIPIAVFFISMSIMRAKPDIFEELKAKFLSTYIYGSILWPTTQFFNFMFVPRANRVLFIGFIELMWTNCLCFMKDLKCDSDADSDADSESGLVEEID